VQLAWDLEEVEEQAVDAVPDAGAVVVGLDWMSEAPRGRPAEHVVDDAHDRRIVRLLCSWRMSTVSPAEGTVGPTGQPKINFLRSSSPSPVACAVVTLR